VSELAFALLNLVLSLFFVLGLGWGLAGVALGTTFAVVLKNLVLIPCYLRYILPLSLPRLFREVIWAVLPAFLPGFVLLLVRGVAPDAGFLALFILSTALIVPYAVVVYFLVLTQDDRSLIARLWAHSHTTLHASRLS